MLYAGIIFWLLIMVFAACGTYQLWAGLIRPHILNVVLLPGTVVAQSGRFVGLLITGANINAATLTASPQAGKSTKSSSKSKLPVVGPVLIALLPMLACGFSIYVVVMTLGQEVMVAAEAPASEATLPVAFSSLWELLRNTLDVAEQVAGTVLNSDFQSWQSWLFVYLIICLTVRMAPMPGTHRGAIGAVLLIGAGLILVGRFGQTPEETLQGTWDLLNFSVGALLCLLLVSLMVRGGVGLFRILTNQSKIK